MKNQKKEQPAHAGSPVDISQLTDAQKAELLAQLNAEAKNDRISKRDAYEGLRGEFMHKAEESLMRVTSDVKGFKVWLEQEVGAFV